MVDVHFDLGWQVLIGDFACLGVAAGDDLDDLVRGNVLDVHDLLVLAVLFNGIGQ